MIKLNRTFFLILFLLFSCIYSDAQVFLTGINSNPVIKEFQKKEQIQKRAVGDTLSLPFFEDFSYQGPYPSEVLWLDSSVFVNRTFSVDPPSAGVATFDALNKNGDLYSTLSQNQSVGDFLQSRIINLDRYTIKNPISILTSQLIYYHSPTGQYMSSDSLWYVLNGNDYNCMTEPTTFNVDIPVTYIMHSPPNTFYFDANDYLYYFDGNDTVPIPYYYTYDYLPSDSIYMSFYYQPQGRSANAPEPADSLVLQFHTQALGWKTVWKVTGTTVKDFKQVMIPINNPDYLVPEFKFRFNNYVSTGGSANPSWNNNCDYWHLDYIYINSGRTFSDTIPDDVVLADQSVSFLKGYTMVPWEHYKTVPSLMEDSIKFIIKNLSDLGKDVQRNVNVYLYPNNLVYNPTPGNENIMSFSRDTAKFLLTSNIFNASQNDTAHYLAKFTVNGGLSQSELFFGENDTIYQDQYFDNYYAHDDGTAENGFGIGGIGTQNALLACRFVTAKPDSLRGVYIYFNPTVNNESKDYFYLRVWSNYGHLPSTLLYDEIGVEPEYEDGIYGFHYYPIDTPQWIVDTFYIGWKKTTTDILNVGFDANYDNKSNILYNITGFWETCPYSGTVMMRPVFSTTPFLSAEPAIADIKPLLYPNPNNGRLYISEVTDAEVSISDIQGRMLYSGSYSVSGIDTSPFENGIYLVTVKDKGRTSTQKIVIQN